MKHREHLADARAGVEEAFTRFAAGRSLEAANEATTRVELIDRVLETLGWTHGTLERESSSGTGDFLDYVLPWEGRPFLALEAKRVGETFRVDPTIFARTRGVTRPIEAVLSLGGRRLQDAMHQVAGYCNDRAIPFACVTNGFQWFLFRGLSTAGATWTRGRVIVFENPEAVTARFDVFVDCLSRQPSARSELPKLLEIPTRAELPEALIPAEQLRFVGRAIDAAAAASMRSVNAYFLAEIHGQDRAPLLDYCYVTPGSEGEFDTTLRRLLRDSAEVVETGSATAASGDDETFLDIVARQDRGVGFQEPVVLVGNIGAGKTTFVHRMIHRLRAEKSAICCLVDLEGEGRGGSFDARAEEQKVAASLLEKLRRRTDQVFRDRTDLSEGARAQADPFHLDTLRTLFRTELTRRKETGRALWEADLAAWPRAEFEILEKLQGDAVTHLQRFIKSFHSRLERTDGGRYPLLLVLDNLDQASDEYQRCIFGLAQRLAHATSAVMVVSLREETFHEGRKPRGFLSSVPLGFVFHISAPPLDRVLRERVRLAERLIEEGDLPRVVRHERDSVRQMCETIRTAFLGERRDGLELVASVTCNNTREALQVSGEVVVGTLALDQRPDGRVDGILDSLAAAASTRGAITRLGLVNCFDAEPFAPPRHALGARLLAYFLFAHELKVGRPSYEALDGVITRFVAWGYRIQDVHDALRRLLEARLLRPTGEHFGEVEADGSLPARISISASGVVHLTRLLCSRPYRAAMSARMRWYDPELARTFVARVDEAGGSHGVSVGDIQVSAALDVFEAYLRLQIEREDRGLVPSLREEPWIREVLTRSAGLLGSAPAPAQLPAFDDERVLASSSSEGPAQQQPLFGAVRGSAGLPRIPRTLEARGSVWIPRILWALEWARRKQLGPRSPADIAKILSAHADVAVEGPNTARALRNFRPEQSEGLWTTNGRRYEITEGGSALLHALVARDP